MPKILCRAYAFKDNPCDERIQILQESCNMIQSLHDACKNLTGYQSRQKNKLGYKSCKNLASRLQVVCIPFQDCLQDCCKILNSSITRGVTSHGWQWHSLRNNIEGREIRCRAKTIYKESFDTERDDETQDYI